MLSAEELAISQLDLHTIRIQIMDESLLRLSGILYHAN